MNAGTVQRAKILWREIEPEIAKGLEIVKNALVDAESIDTVRMLQGKAKAYRDLMKFPESLEARLSEAEAALIASRKGAA